jgi:hypothetical protein
MSTVSLNLRLPPTRIARIHPKLDNEHMVILRAIDTLYAACEKHWQTEQRGFQLGLSEMPRNHQNVRAQITQHQKEHTNLLKEIIAMKRKIMAHINGPDVQHFHWTS